MKPSKSKKRAKKEKTMKPSSPSPPQIQPMTTKLSMASDQSVAAGSQPPAQAVGNAFVQQFYLILLESPQLVYRFYQESSKLGRADANGAMDSVTTMQVINEKILEINYSELKAEIKTVDTQESFYGGVTVLVTGYLTGKDLVKKKFTQSFFLAPQDKGFFVLNDIFRYVDEDDNQLETVNLANGTAAPLSAEQDSPPSHEEAPPHEEAFEEQTSPSAIEKFTLVKVMKENPAPFSVAPVHVRPAPPPTKRAPPPARSAPAPSINPGPPQAPGLPAHVSNVSDNSNAQEAEADGYSIYVRNLPLSATPEQLEEEFKKFGPIKPGGIQVRIHKMQGFCFGFVEFEVASAVQSAVEASPVMIGGRKAFVEKRKPSLHEVNVETMLKRESRDDTLCLTNSEPQFPSKSGVVNPQLQQKVLESLFNIPDNPTHDPNGMNWKKVVKQVESFGQGLEYRNTDITKPMLNVINGKKDEYQVSRNDARKLWDTVRTYRQKAAVAYSKGERANAAQLSETGRNYRKLARKADEEASKEIFEARNKDIKNTVTIDLHGQHVKQGMGLLKLHLLLFTYIPSIQFLKVITGCGDGKGKLKHSVINLVKKEGIEWCLENSGTLRLRLDGRKKYSFMEDDDNESDES